MAIDGPNGIDAATPMRGTTPAGGNEPVNAGTARVPVGGGVLLAIDPV